IAGPIARIPTASTATAPAAQPAAPPIAAIPAAPPEASPRPLPTDSSPDVKFLAAEWLLFISLALRVWELLERFAASDALACAPASSVVSRETSDVEAAW